MARPKKEENIIVLVVEPLSEPRIELVKNELATFQKLVGGLIQVVGHEGYDIVVDEEGKLRRNLLNRKFHRDYLVGTFFITKADKQGQWVSLTNADVEKLTEDFRTGSTKFPAMLGVWG
jgi:hypothetical protein